MPALKAFLFYLIGITSMALLATPALAAEKPATEKPATEKEVPILLTLEWPPYTSAKLPANGFVTKRVQAAYVALGQDTKIAFFPWRSAIRLPYTDHRFTGFFPTYPSRERKQVCHLSEPVGTSPVGFAEPRDKPLSWQRVEDLASYRIGVVAAYANEDTFDRLAKDGRIHTSSSANDAENLLHLINGRIDGAVVDSNVFAWLMTNDARLRPYRDKLTMNKHLLVTWPLFVCFRKDREGAALRDRFNAGLASAREGRALSPQKALNPPQPLSPKSPR